MARMPGAGVLSVPREPRGDGPDRGPLALLRSEGAATGMQG